MGRADEAQEHLIGEWSERNQEYDNPMGGGGGATGNTGTSFGLVRTEPAKHAANRP
jgi:hypothetical protein